MELGEFQSVVLKNPVSSSDDSEFSSLRNRSSSVKNPAAQFTISNLSMHDSNKYFCQLKLGRNAWAAVRSYVTLKVVGKEQLYKVNFFLIVSVWLSFMFDICVVLFDDTNLLRADSNFVVR